MKKNNQKHILLPLQRRKAIADFIKKKEVCETETLAKYFHVSTMTIRRDLKSLERMGHVQLTHGGAISSAAQLREVPYFDKTTSNIKIKQKIAQVAATFIQNDTCIILDAGTSTLELAKLLYTKHLTVITLDLHIALALHSSPHITVYFLGSRVDPLTASCFDTNAHEALLSIRASQAFIGTNAWDAQKGVTCSNEIKKKIKRLMIQSVQESFLLADSSKYGLFSPWHIEDLRTFTHIISDTNLHMQHKASIEHGGARLLQVDAAS